MRMRRTVRNAWIEALRSGDYEQVEGALAKAVHDQGENVRFGYCCLGVLCELAIKQGHELTTEMRDSGFRAYGGQDSFPPVSVAEWLGDAEASWMVRVVAADEDYEEEFDYLNLADENDRGAVFSQIADMIENDLDAADDVRDDLVVTA
jgi:hypothetical protein